MYQELFNEAEEFPQFPTSGHASMEVDRREGRRQDSAKAGITLASPGNLQSSFLCRMQKESQSRSMRLDTTALRYSLNTAMLKPHEPYIVSLPTL